MSPEAEMLDELSTNIMKFFKSIAETRYDFDNDEERAAMEPEVNRYNNYLFNIAKRLNLPAQQMYDEVKESYDAIERGEY